VIAVYYPVGSILVALGLKTDRMVEKHFQGSGSSL
jgi:hypothetical protein